MNSENKHEVVYFAETALKHDPNKTSEQLAEEIAWVFIDKPWVFFKLWIKNLWSWATH